MREVVSLAGYEVATETGSALVAANDETSFYVWTTENAAVVLAEDEPWQRLANVAGTPVYGDERVWRLWSAQGFIFWIKQGPTAAALPSPIELRPLIAASKEIPPPAP